MASRKRKITAPVKLNNVKQQKLAWSLQDMFIGRNGFHEVKDENEVRESTIDDETTLKKRQRVKATNNEPDSLFVHTSFPKAWHCIVGNFEIVLGDSQKFGGNTKEISCRVTIDLVQLVTNESSGNEENTDTLLPEHLRGVSMAAKPSLSQDLIDAIMYLQKKGALFLVLPSEVSILDSNWNVMVCLRESALTNLQFPSQDTTMRLIDKMMKLLMEHFFGSVLSESIELTDTVDDMKREDSLGFDDLFKSVMDKKPMVYHKHSGNEQIKNGLTYHQHTNLKPTLRAYQKRAVLWMLSRERNSTLQDKCKDLHVLWRKCLSLDKKVLFYNPYNARLTTKYFPRPQLPSGGILADEMGLGKTVEVIACVLSHPKPCETTSQLNCKLHISKETESISNEDTKPRHTGKVGVFPMASQSTIDTPTTMQSLVAENIEKIPTVKDAIVAAPSTPHSVPAVLTIPQSMAAIAAAPESRVVMNTIPQSVVTMQTSPQSTVAMETTPHSIVAMETTPHSMVAVQTPPQSMVAMQTTTQSMVAMQTTPQPMVAMQQTPQSMVTMQTTPQSEAVTSVSPQQLVGAHPTMGAMHTTSPSMNNDNMVALPPVIESTVAMPTTLHSTVTMHTTSQSKGTSNTAPDAKSSGKTGVRCECICGTVQGECDILQCSKCSKWLHSKCVRGYQDYDFLCPKCSVNRPPISSRATLIISPATIVHQWGEEIRRHVSQGALKVMVYEGINKKGFMSPEEISDNDIILTTYTTLRAEFYHVNRENGRKMRYQKRYMVVPSPLTAINFWRICLDEAQMVESTTAKAAEMALRLSCVHRWCVTGTPIQRGLEDLYGLLLFLGLYPYCQKVWWKKLLSDPYRRGFKEPMNNALADILWRTAKRDVLDEIHLPCQTEHLIKLRFTPVEEHFYQRQQEECSTWAIRLLGRYGEHNAKLSSLDRHSVSMILTPLLRLRQACCHPQAVRGGFLSIQKSTLTMDQLLENLIAKAKLECEEAHRQLLFAINGLAGIHIIKEEVGTAVDLYRESIRSWKEHEQYFRTDNLQKLHTLHNLNELLTNSPDGCSRAIEDDTLTDKIESHIKEYMIKPNAQVETALSNLENATRHTQELECKADKECSWWISAIGCVQIKGLEVELISRVKDQLSSLETSSIIDSFTNLSGLQFVLTAKLDKLMSTRKSLLDILNGLCCYPSQSMVHITAVCCLRTKEGTATNWTNRCQFCRTDNIFTDYESTLFGHQGMKGNEGQSDLMSTDQHRNTGGLRAETETDKVLKAIFSFIKSYGLSPELHQEAIDHSSLMEALRKEFKVLRAAWFALRERVSCLDELEMCTTRLQLAKPDDLISEHDTHLIPACQVNQQRLKFSSDRFVAQSTLRKRLGQYMYLSNLSKRSNEGENPDTCPICTKSLGRQWSVFTCGHSYCCQCVWVLLRQVGTRSGHVKCPVCRTPTVTEEVSYVSANEPLCKSGTVSVKGSHSTKVEAIVRTVLSITSEESSAKCLIFSTWQDVLELISRALVENDILFRHITCTKRLQANLDDFKNDASVNVLLLPLQSGSNGLNIIEATHVILVEPSLNPGHELQAIGRVHRIGQTRLIYRVEI